MSDKFDNVKEFTKALEAAVAMVEDGDYTEALDDSIGILQGFERTLFMEQRDSSGKAWKPLSLTTILKKKHSVILVDTGDLYESLTMGGGTENTVWDTGRTWLTFGTRLDYAAHHQYGTKNERGEQLLPPRPPVGVDQKTGDKIGQRLGEAVAQFIGDQINA